MTSAKIWATTLRVLCFAICRPIAYTSLGCMYKSLSTSHQYVVLAIRILLIYTKLRTVYKQPTIIVREYTACRCCSATGSAVDHGPGEEVLINLHGRGANQLRNFRVLFFRCSRGRTLSMAYCPICTEITLNDTRYARSDLTER